MTNRDAEQDCLLSDFSLGSWRGHEAIGVSLRVYIEAHHSAIVVDPVDHGHGAVSFGIVNRLELPFAVHESVLVILLVYVSSDNLSLVVQSQTLGEGGIRDIEGGECAGVQEEAVVDVVGVDPETDNLLLVVDAGRLRPAHSSGDG